MNPRYRRYPHHTAHHRYPGYKFPAFIDSAIERVCDRLDALADAGIPGWMADSFWGTQSYDIHEPVILTNRVNFCIDRRLVGVHHVPCGSSNPLMDHPECYKTEVPRVYVLVVSPYSTEANDADAARIGLTPTEPLYCLAATTYYVNGTSKQLVDVLQGKRVR